MLTTIYTVYKTTNQINEKIYIGVHATTNPNDDYMGSGNLIKKSILKHGKENFIKSILFEYDNEQDAYLKEKELVNKSFIQRNDTYNLMLGGYGSSGFSTKTKLKMSKSKSGKNSPHFKGYYITPYGKFITSKEATTKLLSLSSVKNWCKNPDKIISNKSYVQSPYLKSLNENPVGKSPRDIGFGFMYFIQ